VESPAKAKTINKYLGKEFVVKASLGHIKDLPKRDLAVDVDHGFEPRYEVIEGKKKLIADLKQTAGKVQEVYLAADPDREGEAICYHLQEELRGRKNGPRFFRVMCPVTEVLLASIRTPWAEGSPQRTRRIQSCTRGISAISHRRVRKRKTNPNLLVRNRKRARLPLGNCAPIVM